MPVFAQLSPGELSASHQHLSGIRNCTNCHVLGKGQRVADKKCLECHQPLVRRINSGRGYHARIEGRCVDCHSEHNGEEFRLIYWKNGRDQFDHAQTGFILRGKHKGVTCKKCHRTDFIVDEDVLQWERKHIDKSQEMAFLGLPTQCIGCHKDYHQGQLSEMCEDCHIEDSWKPAQKFDHTTAKFPLSGKHQGVQCKECHKRETVTSGLEPTVRYVGLEYRECSACHKDVHKGQFESNCAKCHTSKGWQMIERGKFNHDLTDYALRGKHATVSCERCHKPGEPKKPFLHGHCVDCHDDYHEGQFTNRQTGIGCEPCHSVDGFIPAKYTVQDHRQTRFPLTGAHAAQPCIFCHEVEESEREIFRWELLKCPACHEDIHQGQFAERLQGADCDICHRLSAWADLKFSHEDSEFLLRGAHRTTACSQCHKPQNPEDQKSPVQYTRLSKECASCHEDIHYGQFIKEERKKLNCEGCHTSSAWTQVLFDHNSMSRFPLKGKHNDVACRECHPVVVDERERPFVRYKPLGVACQDCHSLTEMDQ